MQSGKQIGNDELAPVAADATGQYRVDTILLVCELQVLELLAVQRVCTVVVIQVTQAYLFLRDFLHDPHPMPREISRPAKSSRQNGGTFEGSHA